MLELIRDSWRPHRHQAVRQAVAADPVPPAGLRRGDLDVDRQGDRKRSRHHIVTSPWEFAPTSQQQLEWPKWGQYYETKGMAGEPPDLPSAVELKKLYEGWLGATSRQEKTLAWREILQIWADEVFSIGTVGGVLQPVVVNDSLRNVPEKGIVQLGSRRLFRHVQAGPILVRLPAARREIGVRCGDAPGASRAAPRCKACSPSAAFRYRVGRRGYVRRGSCRTPISGATEAASAQLRS